MPRFPYDREEEGDRIWGIEAVSEVPVLRGSESSRMSASGAV